MCRSMAVEMDKSNIIFWTEDEMEQLIDLWNNQGRSSSEIGLILGKTPKAIISKIKRLRRRGVELVQQTRWGVRKKQPVNEDKGYRKCLRCRGLFLSKHKLNRICRDCNTINKGINEASIMRLLK